MGGNHTSRYNWRLGNAWNPGADWFFRNTNYSADPAFSWRNFLLDNYRRGVATAMTLPMIGWVAKDTESSSFPVSLMGPQQSVDPFRPDAGNGMAPDGKELSAPDPRRTSVAMPPEEIGEWVRAIRSFERQQGRSASVRFYLLDNEPMLWHRTHRDLHPEPVGYAELLDRTIRYASAIKRADPRATIAGPAEWGWPNYFYSAADLKAGVELRPDRRAHADVPLLAWYLRELHRYEKKTGVRLLDVLDVHYYPQDVPKDQNDEATRARRLRATRSLWDPTYRDESWIDDRVMLLPRLRKLVDENYPGLGISLGEYNFGGEGDMSGALALAEVLGRFTEEPRLTAAFYFSYPPAGSPAFQAFRAFRNYDGAGGEFLGNSLKVIVTPAGVGVTEPPLPSLFASRDNSGRRMVLVAINPEPGSGRSRRLDVELTACGSIIGSRVFRYRQGTGSLALAGEGEGEGLHLQRKAFALDVPSYSIVVVELAISPAPRGTP